MAAPSQHTLTSDPELFPLEECAKGEEMKCMGYLNKEVCRLEEEGYLFASGYKFWPMETQADWHLSSAISPCPRTTRLKSGQGIAWPLNTSACP